MIYWSILSVLILVSTINGSSQSSLSYSADVSSMTDKKVQGQIKDVEMKHDVPAQSISQVHEIMRRANQAISEPIMHHHDHRHEVISGSIVAKSPTETAITIEVDEKKSDDRQTPPPPSNDNYTKRFVVVTNSITAITTALIGAGVAILIHFKGCNG